jgi:hypothetical protein
MSSLWSQPLRFSFLSILMYYQSQKQLMGSQIIIIKNCYIVGSEQWYDPTKEQHKELL